MLGRGHRKAGKGEKIQLGGRTREVKKEKGGKQRGEEERIVMEEEEKMRGKQ